VFIMFTETLDEDHISGPNETKYYSKEDKGVYYLYQWNEGNRMTSDLGRPVGLDELNGTQFGITGRAVIPSTRSPRGSLDRHLDDPRVRYGAV